MSHKSIIWRHKSLTYSNYSKFFFSVFFDIKKNKWICFFINNISNDWLFKMYNMSKKKFENLHFILRLLEYIRLHVWKIRLNGKCCMTQWYILNFQKSKEFITYEGLLRVTKMTMAMATKFLPSVSKHWFQNNNTIFLISHTSFAARLSS